MNVQLVALSLFAFLIVIKNLLYFYYFEYWQIYIIRDLKVNLKVKCLKNIFQDDYEKI